MTSMNVGMINDEFVFNFNVSDVSKLPGITSDIVN